MSNPDQDSIIRLIKRSHLFGPLKGWTSSLSLTKEDSPPSSPFMFFSLFVFREDTGIEPELKEIENYLTKTFHNCKLNNHQTINCHSGMYKSSHPSLEQVKSCSSGSILGLSRLNKA